MHTQYLFLLSLSALENWKEKKNGREYPKWIHTVGTCVRAQASNIKNRKYIEKKIHNAYRYNCWDFSLSPGFFDSVFHLSLRFHAKPSASRRRRWVYAMRHLWREPNMKSRLYWNQKYIKNSIVSECFVSLRTLRVCVIRVHRHLHRVANTTRNLQNWHRDGKRGKDRDFVQIS